jgi:hypothetical protein
MIGQMGIGIVSPHLLWGEFISIPKEEVIGMATTCEDKS